MKQLLIIIFCAVIFPQLLQSSFPRKILVEEFSSSDCGVCADVNLVFKEKIYDRLDFVIPLSFLIENDGPLYYRINERIKTYFPTSYALPSSFVNGKRTDPVISAEVADKLMGETSPVKIDINTQKYGRKFTVSVKVYTEENLIGDNRLFLAAVQRSLLFEHPVGSNGETFFKWVVTEMFPGPAPSHGVPVKLNSRESVQHEFVFDPGAEIELSNIYFVAFLQKFGSPYNEILQASTNLVRNKELPFLKASRDTLDFNKVDNEKNIDLVLYNPGGAELDIDTIFIKSTGDKAFTIRSVIPGRISPGDSSVLRLNFYPFDNNYYSSELIIECNGDNIKTKKIYLSGIGFNIDKQPYLTAEPSEMDFGEVSSGKKTLKLINTGRNEMIINSITFQYQDDIFLLNYDRIPVISPKDTFLLNVLFKPHSDSLYYNYLTIFSNSANPYLTVGLMGRGNNINEKADLEISVDILDFGIQNFEVTKSISIINKGYKPLEIYGSFIEKDTFSVFSILDKIENETLLHYETKSVRVNFKPAENRNYTAVLKIQSNTDDLPTPELILKGSGDSLVSVFEIYPQSQYKLIKILEDGRKDILHIMSLYPDKEIVVRLFDIRGKSLRKFEMKSSNVLLINTRQYFNSAGLYYLVATDGKSVQAVKIFGYK